MCTLDSLTLLSQVAGKVHAGEGAAMSTASFGGLNVMLMGDFHQFPPVGNTNAALYSNSPVRNTVIVGKAIYLQFETVINLTSNGRLQIPDGWKYFKMQDRENALVKILRRFKSWSSQTQL